LVARIEDVDKFITEEAMLQELEDVGVVRVKRCIDKTTKKPKGTVVLTFKQLPLPEAVSLGFYRHRLLPYSRPEVRCYSCLRFGHIAKVCRGKRSCFTCGESDHIAADCHNEAKCVHCKGSHTTVTCPSRPML